MDDLISREYLVEHIHACMENDRLMQTATKEEILQMVADTPSAQPEEKVTEILNYLDTELHPIISPEHWYVYSELHDMISSLPSEQPERKKGKWRRRLVDCGFNADWRCSECGWKTSLEEHGYNFCPNCGADMRGKQNG